MKNFLNMPDNETNTIIKHSDISQRKRTFLPEELKVTKWDDLRSYFEDLLSRDLNTVEKLDRWLLDRSELTGAVGDDFGWRYIKMSCNTSNEKFKESYDFFISHIQPEITGFMQKLNEKMLSSPCLDKLTDIKYQVFIRQIKNNVEIFREENIPLFTRSQLKQKEYSAIIGAMTVRFGDEELPIPIAATKLQEADREVREDAFIKIQARRNQDSRSLNSVFTELVVFRHQIALNAGFENYRDYKFRDLGRFDYTPDDCLSFHESIATEVVPLVDRIMARRKKLLGVDKLKPWDLEADLYGKKPMKPFRNADDLIAKSIHCFNQLHPYFGECLEIMNHRGHLDLESRKGKAPGGYNYPLYEADIPFIFMNSAGTPRDVTTMVHEGGHAIHSFLTADLPLIEFREFPSEIAELASMSMELFSMEYWDVFYDNEEDLKRAKLQQLTRVVLLFPWIAVIDKFQHWVYLNYDHTEDERTKAWTDIYSEFSSNVIDWSGHERSFSESWMKQLHLFEVPFYYIEYAIAQLGAIGFWIQFRNNPKQAIDNYISALKLGYTKPLPQIYERAGLRFDFSREYVRDLVQFVYTEMESYQ